MGTITVKARIASTHPVEKYGGVQLDVRVLHQMATALNAGQLPMNFDHSVLEPIEVRNVRAAVVELGDGQHAVDATFDVDGAAWEPVQDRFDAAGVPGGFSFSAGETQLAPSGGRDPQISLSADAAEFTDDDRAEAWRLLEVTGPANVTRLYQFSAHEFIRVIVDVWAIAGPFVVNLASSGMYDALKFLVGRHQEPTTVEIHEHRPDGSRSTALIRTNDPTMLRAALEALPDATEPVQEFDAATGRWLPPGQS